MNRSDKKKIIWNVIGVMAGICLAIYILVLLYYNPYYHYETFLKKEWFFIISAVIVGGIFSFFIIDTLYQERYIDELEKDQIMKRLRNDNLNKENLKLIDEIKKQDKEIKFLRSLLKEADEENSMLNESAASWEEEPPQPEI